MCDPHFATIERAGAARAATRQAGFTLIEIMAVVLIMGLLVGVVGVGVVDRLETARITTTKAKISTLESALEFYHMDNSQYPPTLDGLQKAPPNAKNFPRGGYVKRKEALLDSWDQEFQYTNPGSKNPNGVDISSPGPDGISGNEDDVNNWTDEGGE